MQGRKASLSDLTSIGDINALSVRQLKEILARNFVNYKGCCEKWELLERVTRLYKEKDLQHLGKKLRKRACFPGFFFLRTVAEGNRTYLTFLFCASENGGSVCDMHVRVKVAKPLCVAVSEENIMAALESEFPVVATNENCAPFILGLPQ